MKSYEPAINIYNGSRVAQLYQGGSWHREALEKAEARSDQKTGSNTYVAAENNSFEDESDNRIGENFVK